MFIVQRGWDRMGGRDGYPPRAIETLPADIAELDEGDWKYSEMLRGFVGHQLSQKRVKELYHAQAFDGRLRRDP